VVGLWQDNRHAAMDVGDGLQPGWIWGMKPE